jgi:uncharacterized membrane protein YbhN (UPF0104 family)
MSVMRAADAIQAGDGSASDAPMSAAAEPMPDELSPHRLRRRLLEIAAVLVAVVVVVALGPGLGSLRSHLAHASPGWLVVAIAFEVLSTLSYVVVFRAVFCPRMRWGLSYQIGMAEQGANSVLSVSGAGGLALGVWALRRGGMSVDHIGRRTVAFFFLTSLANVGTVMLFAALYALGVIGHDRNPALTYGFGIAGLIVTVIVVALPAMLRGRAASPAMPSNAGRLAAAVHFARHSLAQGVQDGLLLLRRRSLGVLAGSLGVMAFDIAVLGAAFRAFGASPAVGMLVLGYLIGQLGGALPVPAGIGGIDAGLIGVFALYHQPLAATTAAVLVYHAIALWVPGLLGSVAFAGLRNTLRREERPAAMCAPLAEPLEVVRLPALAE